MISAPVTASTNLGVTGDENKMRIGDQIMRITALSKLNTKYYENWNPVVSSDIENHSTLNGDSTLNGESRSKKYTK